MPDLDLYYDLSSNARKENTLTITEVTPVADHVDEILFYLQRTLHTDQGDENGGTWFLAHPAKTVDGHKLLKLWIQDYAYEMMQKAK